MEFDKTYFPYFNHFCIEKFGPDLGSAINDAAENILLKLLKEADYRNNKYIQWHMDTNMLPTIAIYMAFKKFEITAGKAYAYTDEALQPARLINRRKNQAIGRLPFGYYAFKLFCRPAVIKQYPGQGWDIEWIRYDKHELHFNMNSCIYLETTQKYHCAEMCPLFCANDDVILSGYQPAIVFERKGTLALGQDVCDFHFKNQRYAK